MLDAFRLDGQVAVVTGGTRGLGAGLAVGLAEAGADICVLGRTPAVETGAAVTSLGRRFAEVPCDLLTATPAGLQAAVGDVVARMGRIDILVNNAGIIRRSPAIDFSEADWDDVLQVNLKAPYFLSQAAARAMAPNGRGKIIHIASMLSFQGGILVSSYTAAKSGIAGLTHALANEWAGRRINVNAIAPGYMATDVTAPLRADEQRNRAILDRIPAGRWGASDDLKGAVVFLASPASDYVHGTILPVDGGWLSR
ncbi:MAG: 2-dehydro-3-deoxy-D-gluconate 5-dehydrogenase KduD [Anaerolineales bacterium]|nr:2-dehydro-3-deoxy-D-gluconate 5-dehydrogenase KduD [Anaerolineales bacterium]MCB9141182.1 2-dehydro-3-deoxy-D-gluconate 5-dehydrogenase KduD [Anaerolineales bacterium]